MLTFVLDARDCHCYGCQYSSFRTSGRSSTRFIASEPLVSEDEFGYDILLNFIHFYPESIAASSLILGFNTAFWPENVGVFKLMPEENLESFPIWINMNRVVGRPLLMARTFGKTALFVENEEESVVKNKGK